VTHGAFRPAAGRAIRDVAARLRHSERGQSLTELALILPVLLLLTTVALDFGRIYLGYINIQNMARIAANYAANNPLAWGATPDTAVQLRYRNQILEDMAATNCVLPVAGGAPVIPSPTFVDANADGTTGGLGDMVRVQLNCSFTVATPMISGILGGSVAVSAESDFPVKAGMTAVVPQGVSGGGGGGGVTAPPVAGFVANSSVFVPGTSQMTVSGPDVTVDFRDASGGGPGTSFEWAVWYHGTLLATSTSQDHVHAFSCVPPSGANHCDYWVHFTVSNPYGSSDAWLEVDVRLPAEVQFTADRQVINRGQTVTFTDQSSTGGTAWDWYINGTIVGSGQTFTQAFNVVGIYTVKLLVTYPEGPAELTKSSYITVNPGYCTVPSLNNVRFNDAPAVWQGAPYQFTGTVKRATGAPNGNFLITAQSIAAGNGATALCTSDLYVSSP
jgi:Flp pilus assembly protein TadG